MIPVEVRSTHFGPTEQGYAGGLGEHITARHDASEVGEIHLVVGVLGVGEVAANADLRAFESQVFLGEQAQDVDLEVDFVGVTVDASVFESARFGRVRFNPITEQVYGFGSSAW